jgi:hypothetical protein
MCTLAYLFHLTDVKRSLLDNLLPYDIGRVLVATGCQLTTREKSLYMNPVRDVFNKWEEIELLTRAGINIILLGRHAYLLTERLRNTDNFIHKYGNDFTIDLIAIAYRSPESVTGTAVISTQTPSVRFTVNEKILTQLGSQADLAYSWLEHDVAMLPCTNTSLASFETPATTNIRLKQFKVNLRCSWFNTIDFVYPEEAYGIFDWSYDEDVIETSSTLLRHDGEGITLYDTRSYGSWLRELAHGRTGGRGTPALTQHRPSVNMQEVLVRIEIPHLNKVGIIRVPSPC